MSDGQEDTQTEEKRISDSLSRSAERLIDGFVRLFTGRYGEGGRGHSEDIYDPSPPHPTAINYVPGGRTEGEAPIEETLEDIEWQRVSLSPASRRLAEIDVRGVESHILSRFAVSAESIGQTRQHIHTHLSFPPGQHNHARPVLRRDDIRETIERGGTLSGSLDREFGDTEEKKTIETDKGTYTILFSPHEAREEETKKNRAVEL